MTRRLPPYPEPLTKEEQKIIYRNQTEIMDWLRSRGCRVAEDHEMRSCTMKKRYSIEPSCRMNEVAYPCRYCSGWHKATKRVRETT